jgi:hypothetical protein
MIVQHKCSEEIFDLSEPNYGKHWNSIYGQLIMTIKKEILFFYQVDDATGTEFEDLTGEFNIL